MIPVSLAGVPSLHRFTWYWGHEFSKSDDQGLMLRLRELLKHTSVREPVVWSSIRKGARSGLVLVFQRSEVKLAAPFFFLVVEQH